MHTVSLNMRLADMVRFYILEYGKEHWFMQAKKLPWPLWIIVLAARVLPQSSCRRGRLRASPHQPLWRNIAAWGLGPVLLSSAWRARNKLQANCLKTVRDFRDVPTIDVIVEGRVLEVSGSHVGDAGDVPTPG